MFKRCNQCNAYMYKGICSECLYRDEQEMVAETLRILGKPPKIKATEEGISDGKFDDELII